MRPVLARLTAALVMCLLTATARPAPVDAPRFTIESVRVEGLRLAPERIVVAETKLAFGSAYTEPQLQDALSRVQRLPFVIHAEFALQRGTVRDQYILVITIEETKALFFDYGALYERAPGINHNEEYPNLGARVFVGSRGVLMLRADTHGDDRFSSNRPLYGLAYTQYDLFGTRASITAAVQYRKDYLDLHGFQQVVGRQGLRFGDHLLYDITAAQPLFGNNAIRASWHREIGLVLSSPTARLIKVVQVHYDDAEVAWLYNSTNDLLYPTSGTYAEARVETQSFTRLVPIEGLPEADRSSYYWQRDAHMLATRYFALSDVQSIMLGAEATAAQDRPLRQLHLRGGYASTWISTRPGIGTSTLRFECSAEQVLTLHDQTYSIAVTGLAVRTAWGVAHLDLRYVRLGASR
jgi:hypothetical protein